MFGFHLVAMFETIVRNVCVRSSSQLGQTQDKAVIQSPKAYHISVLQQLPCLRHSLPGLLYLIPCAEDAHFTECQRR